MNGSIEVVVKGEGVRARTYVLGCPGGEALCAWPVELFWMGGAQTEEQVAAHLLHCALMRERYDRARPEERLHFNENVTIMTVDEYLELAARVEAL